ncbi:MAG: TRAP transporter small permease [Bacillota bacterium]|nr:TRAP transporter small permease [Bacillota bacterium]
MIASRIHKINNAFKYFLNFILASMVLVVFAQVIFRFVLSKPLPWSEEISRYMMVWITFLGAALAIEKKAHALVEFFVDLLPEKLRVIVKVIAIILSCVFYGIIAFYGWNFLSSSLTQFSAVLQLPMAYVYIVIPLSGILLILNSLAELEKLILRR